jgi:outer membrane lipoprotein-sorting protein
MLGFVPTGSALKQRFNVALVENSMLDGESVLSFLLTPKRKKGYLTATAIARIQLWVDPESGLPVQHQIAHVSGDAKLSVRYLSVSPDDTLPDSLFQPAWPEGTTIVRR